MVREILSTNDAWQKLIALMLSTTAKTNGIPIEGTEKCKGIPDPQISNAAEAEAISESHKA